MAVKAFDAEIATIAHSTKTPEAAAIRYEFWHIGLERIKSRQSVEGHPVLEDLFRAKLSTSQLNLLEETLNTRATGLDRKIYSLVDLDDYSQKSLVPILQVIEEISYDTNNDRVKRAVDHLGKAQVSIRRLKGFGKGLILKNRIAEQFIPTSLLGMSGLNGPQLIQESSKSEKIKDLVREMAQHSLAHLDEVEFNNDLFLKLSTFACKRYISKLKDQNYDICSEKIVNVGSQRDGFLSLRLYLKSLFTK